jgi:hypothetical protein
MARCMVPFFVGVQGMTDHLHDRLAEALRVMRANICTRLTCMWNGSSADEQQIDQADEALRAYDEQKAKDATSAETAEPADRTRATRPS